MTDRQISLARRLFPDKRPRHTHFRRFYNERQLQWFRTHYPDTPTDLIADIMHETTANVANYAYRIGLRQNPQLKSDRLLPRLAEYRRRELHRIRYGLSRLGRMPVTAKPYSVRQLRARHSALRRGYILGDNLDETDRWFIYYDEHTTRSTLFEHNLEHKYHLWLKPLTQ